MEDPSNLPEPERPPARPRRRRRRPRPATPVGASPGTLHADPEAPPTTVAAIGYGHGALVERRPASLADLVALRQTCPNVWVDVTGFRDVAVLQQLGEQFGLHRLALEDLLNVQQRAKVEDFGEHAFLLLRMIDHSPTHETEQFGVFVGPGFVVTFQERPGDCFGLVRKRLADPAGQMARRGSDYLAYALLDAVVDAYFPVVEGLDRRLDEIEESVLAGTTGSGVVQELHGVRRSLLELRRAVWPLREAISSLVRGEGRHFSADVRPYLRDVHDHVVQLLDLLENYRELGGSLLELHLSNVNYRLNEVMKFLTIIATIFIPLTFLVGVYGMNFQWMPELRVWWGYPACLLLMAGIAGFMLWWFRRRGWL
ncbi:MAG: magnesium/cobalt transporter CorA [Planctomycetes bacterium]|nr:magnesium/cobalt transporter CorA [Planctomycetota bacterium]